MTTVAIAARGVQSGKSLVVLFLYLQILDILTTMIGFSLGNAEASPFIRILVRFGPVQGLILSKLIAAGLAALCLAMRRTSLVRLINYWYAVLVIWNLGVILHLLNT